MTLSPSELNELADVAEAAAQSAGEMIARSRPQSIEHKSEATTPASQVVTEIDRASEQIIVQALEPTIRQYSLALLTEESEDDGGRLTAEYFWCIDPLDGTLPYIEGSRGYSVSIALVDRSGRPHIGVVYDPLEKITYRAAAGVGVFRDGLRWIPKDASTGEVFSVFVTSGFSMRAEHAELLDVLEQIAAELGCDRLEVFTTGGAVLKACWALASSPACFILLPGPTGASLWDFAATACLFDVVGEPGTAFDGSPLDLNREESTNMGERGVVFATDSALAARIRSLLVT